MSSTDGATPTLVSGGGLLACLAAMAIFIGMPGLVRADDSEVPVNEGGVLLVHDHGIVTAEPDSACSAFDLGDWKDARVEAPVEEGTRLIGVYAAFAPEDSVLLAGVTFGVLYSPSVTVVAHGGCGNRGMQIDSPGWPDSRSGVATVLLPFRTESLVPIYWFLVKTSGPGTFEVTPHPFPEHGGMFGSGHPAPRATPITRYGTIGFGNPGVLPEPGEPAEVGVCCVEKCVRLSPRDCAWFTGVWLGADGDCSTSPCDPGAETGACCLGVECVLETRLDCVLQGGRFLGEGASCDGIDCIEEIDVAPN
jgi:hypothetical protein